ncbi:MAG: response regulator [bacterium]
MVMVETSRILFVEDEPLALELLSRALGEKGYEVHSFSCPAAALAWFENHSDKIDILITDQSMPNFTGAQLIERAHIIREKLPSIIVTGLGSVSGTYLKTGPTSVLQKPFKRQQLIDAIKNLIQENL